MGEFCSARYAETLANMRAKRLADPEFWLDNSKIQSHPAFKQAAINFANKLREKS